MARNITCDGCGATLDNNEGVTLLYTIGRGKERTLNKDYCDPCVAALELWIANAAIDRTAGKVL